MFQSRSRARNRGRIIRTLASLGLAAGLGLAARPVTAAEVTPGMSIPLSGTTVMANPGLAGSIVADDLRPFEIRDGSGAVVLRGTLQDRVMRSSATGQLIFAPRLGDLETGVGGTWAVTLHVAGYAGVETDVEYRTDGMGSVGPVVVHRTPGAGGALGFEYRPGSLVPPDEGRFLSILTDARHFTAHGAVTLSARNITGGPWFTISLEANGPDRDGDSDGVPDSADRCPTFADPEQLDSDGNGIGDACECGDQNGDGRVDVADIVAINQAIFDPKLATPLCDANGDGRCSVEDIVAANRRIFGGQAHCAARPAPGSPSFVVDPALKPELDGIPFSDGTGDRPVAAVSDDRGHRIDFVENEVIVALRDPAELPAIMTRLDATLLGKVDPADAGAPAGLPVFYLLKASPRPASPSELVDLIVASGAENGAQHRLSSQAALDLLTAIGRETHDAGTQLGANFLVRYDGLSERTTREAPTASGGAGYTPDAFQWPYMSTGSVQDIGAAEAARMIRDGGRTPAAGSRVGFMILDGGFSSTADYPTPLLPGGSRLDVRNPNSCSGGSSCPWHGTAVASTALSIFDDGRGAAGPASQVASPIFVQSPNPNFWDYLEYIFGTLPSAFGRFPEIVNISASGDIPAGLCLVGVCTAVDLIGSSVHAAGMLVFASAGNDGANVDDEDCFIGCWESFYRVPCEAPGVVCVGGLAHASTAKDPASAFGAFQRRSSGSVDIYGPFSTWVHDDPDGGTTNARFVSGTSFSSPFAASVGALIKAANPSLSASGIWNTMRDNAHTLSAGRVHRWLDAYEAVRAALGGNVPPFAQIVSPIDGQRFSWSASNPPLVCNVDDDGGAAALAVSWTSDRDGSIGAASASTSAGRLSLGTHRITCTASDGRFAVSDSVSIRIENDAPSVVINSPSSGSRFFFSQTIPIAATPNDVNGNFSSLRWEALRSGTVVWSATGTTATIPARTLAPATYTLRATATDTLGLSGSAQITLIVATDPVDLPPSISGPTITPLPGVGPFDAPPSSFWVDDCPVDVNGSAPGNGYCQRLRFNATVSDDHDPVASLSYTYEVRRGGTLVSTTMPSSAQATLDLVAGSYQVRLIVEDSAGNTSSFSWNFTIDELI